MGRTPETKEVVQKMGKLRWDIDKFVRSDGTYRASSLPVMPGPLPTVKALQEHAAKLEARVNGLEDGIRHLTDIIERLHPDQLA